MQWPGQSRRFYKVVDGFAKVKIKFPSSCDEVFVIARHAHAGEPRSSLQSLHSHYAHISWSSFTTSCLSYCSVLLSEVKWETSIGWFCCWGQHVQTGEYLCVVILNLTAKENEIRWMAERANGKGLLCQEEQEVWWREQTQLAKYGSSNILGTLFFGCGMFFRHKGSVLVRFPSCFGKVTWTLPFKILKILKQRVFLTWNLLLFDGWMFWEG